MKKRCLAILFVSFPFLAVSAQNLLPVTDTLGKLSISVDPRIELLGAVQLVSNYPYCTQGVPYSDKARTYFAPYADSDAAKYTKELLSYGFGYDAPVAMMLPCSYPPELSVQQPYTDGLKRRAEKEENIESYRNALSEFARTSCFAGFWADNELYYRSIVDRFKSALEGADIVRLVEDYYRMKKGSYHLIVCPLFGGNNYACRMRNDFGTDDVYTFLGPIEEKDGTLSIDRIACMTTLFHEFGHSFVNPLTERYSDEVMRYSSRFESIREKMTEMGYGTWMSCVNEHIVRAVEIRMLEAIGRRDLAQHWLERELRMHFGYIRPVLEKLREYETLRDSDGISFEEYLPVLLNVFGEVDPYVPQFVGPIVDALWGVDTVCVYPTSGDESSVAVADYAKIILKHMNSQLKEHKWVLVADSTALNMPLENYNIVCYGTVESNLLLKKYKSSLPFHEENNLLCADRKYEEKDVKLIFCIPNPQNPKRGMAVYTALDNREIVGINGIDHGAEDYYIFTGRNHLLSSGFFDKKEGVWNFPQP